MKPNLILNFFLNNKKQNYATLFGVILFGVVLLAISAQITLPYYPFLITLLDISALFCAMAFGPSIAISILILYYLLGLMGLPILINHTHGLQELLNQHAGGYYLSLIPAILLTGYLTEQGWGKHFTTSFCAASLGMILFMLMDSFIIGLHFDISTIWTHAISPVLEINLFKIIALSIVIPKIYLKRLDVRDTMNKKVTGNENE